MHMVTLDTQKNIRVGARWRRRAIIAAALFSLASCTAKPDDRVVRIDVIGESEQLAHPLRHSTSRAGQMMLAAAAQGLLTFNAKGDVVGALAESWIVEDGGQSYIFRLKRLHWPDGEPVRADQVARLLQERLRADPLPLAGLAPEVKVMTDRVIEIRLKSSLPAFLQLLAQPRFGILSRKGGTGPYRAKATDDGISLTLIAPALSQTGDASEAAATQIDHRVLTANRAALALVRYQAGLTDLVVGGRFQDLPLAPAVGLPMTDLRTDPTEGLFGLAFVGNSNFLGDVAVRDALSRAIDRAQLAQALALPNWRTAVYPLPAPYELTRLPSAPAWIAQPVADRTASARGVIGRWAVMHGDPPILRIALPDGAGASKLFIRIARDFAQLGVGVKRVASNAPADLRLIDEVAPFDSAFWYLARLDCAAGLLCDSNVAKLLAQARNEQDDAEQARLLGEAEHATVAFAGYIPLGQPIRWSLVGRRLTGFQPSPRGFHPLNGLITAPN